MNVIEHRSRHALPEKGSRGWRHPNFGGAYRVHSVGSVWVTLKAETPLHGYPNTTRTLVALWPAHEGAYLLWQQTPGRS